MALSVAQFAQVADWQVVTSPKTVNVTWSAGDIVVVIGGSEDSQAVLGNPSVTGLTFGAADASSVTASQCGAWIWASSAAAAGGSGNVSITRSGNGTLNWGFACWVITGSPTGKANALANNTESAISRTVSAGSIVVYGLMDYNATNPPGKTPLTGSGTATERRDLGNGTNYGQYLCDWVGTAAGTFNFGPNNYTSLMVAQVIIEITAPAAAATGPASRHRPLGLLYR